MLREETEEVCGSFDDITNIGKKSDDRKEVADLQEVKRFEENNKSEKMNKVRTKKIQEEIIIVGDNIKSDLLNKVETSVLQEERTIDRDNNKPDELNKIEIANLQDKKCLRRDYTKSDKVNEVEDTNFQGEKSFDKNNTKSDKLKKNEVTDLLVEKDIEGDNRKSEELNKDETRNIQEETNIEEDSTKSEGLNKDKVKNIQEEKSVEGDTKIKQPNKHKTTNLQKESSIERNKTESDNLIRVDNINVEEAKGIDVEGACSNKAIEANKIESCDKISNLMKILQSLQCPFSWKLDNEITVCIMPEIIEMIKERDGDCLFRWKEFISRLVLCYGYYCKNNIDSAFVELRNCETIVNNSDNKIYIDAFFQSTRSALLHVILACKCYLYLEKGNLNEVKTILDNICKEEEMDRPCKAAIWGIKAAVTMAYRNEGIQTALGYLKEALEIEKEQGEWHFLLGKCLRYIRLHYPTKIPTLEEIKSFEEAVNMSQNPLYMVFLAQTYLETTHRTYILYKCQYSSSLKNELRKMNKRASELYMKALDIEGENFTVTSLCAKGFCKLPPPYKDIEKAKECCEKTFKLAPDNKLAHHIRGNIYDIDEHDYQNAKKHYEKSGYAGLYGPFIDLLRLEFKMDHAYNPIPLLEYMLEKFSDENNQEQTRSHMGSYYFYIKDDLPTAFKHWRDIIKQNPHSNKLKNHRALFVHTNEFINIYVLLYDEAKLALRFNSSSCDENVKLFQEIMDICCTLFPELTLRSPRPRYKNAFNESDINCNKSKYTQKSKESKGFKESDQRRERDEDSYRNQSEGNERGASRSQRYTPGNRKTSSNRIERFKNWWQK